MMKRMSAVLGVLVLAACGGGGGGSPTAPSTPAPTPPTASASALTLGVRNATFTVHSTTTVGRWLLKCGDFHAEWILTESAGLRAAVTGTDFYLLELDGDIDGRKVTSGGDVVPAGGQFVLTTDRNGGYCGYMDRDYPAIMKGTVDLTDDRGNKFTLSGETAFVER